MRAFPIFLSFDRKPPLVVGGGELAAAKVRLLLKRAQTVGIAADRDVLVARACQARQRRFGRTARVSARH